MHKARSRQLGFTIVELLVVIVVIGILAAIAIVSCTGISQKAIVASLQSDLKSGSDQLKIYQVTNSKFPGSVTDCPSPALANTRVKLRGQNYVDSYTVDNNTNPQTFVLTIKNGSLTPCWQSPSLYSHSDNADDSCTASVLGGRQWGTMTHDSSAGTRTYSSG